MRLSELADRVEALTGPCRETDADICEALGRQVDRGCPIEWHSDEETPRYTASIDTATLLLAELSPQAQIAAFVHALAVAGEKGDLATHLPLALVAAALRALETSHDR